MAHVEIVFLTTSEAGRQFNPPLSAAAVRAACNRGEVAVAAHTVGGARLIHPDEIVRVLRVRKAKGSGCQTARAERMSTPLIEESKR